MRPRFLLLLAFCFILLTSCGSPPAPTPEQMANPPEPESLNVQDSIDKTSAPQSCQSF